MRGIFFITLLFVALGVNAQDKSFSLGLGYVFFGDGDYSGINYINSFQFPIFESMDLKIGAQIANAAETDEEYYYHRHNVFNFANNYNLVITPINFKIFSLSISTGAIWRYRTEIVFKSSKTVYTESGSPFRMIENEYNKSLDVGYNFDVTVLFRITEKVNVGLCGQFVGYNKGSGLYAVNLCLNYRL
jgi:hypothetical protein